jgi:hypothetical protein
VNAALLCAVNPPPPTDPGLKEAIAAASAMLVNASERERSNYRTTTPPCSGCHMNFDAYGLALDTYDGIGKYRTMDPQGRPIDPSVTLPANLGSQMATDTLDMEKKIAGNAGFDACIAKNMMNWAYAEGSNLTPNSCSTQDVVKAFATSDKSYSSLLTKIAAAQSFSNRKAGVQ